ncbi:MAG: SDR family NAD(P)-dependent oxidoreductase [Vulcanimicrobiaceae bacterium]
MLHDLQGKTALVTGGDRGIGAAIVGALADIGCNVAVTYHKRGVAAADVLRHVREGGGKIEVFRVDLTDRAAIRALVEGVHAKFGPIDILVNNAGIGLRRQLDEISEDDWDSHLALNVTSAFLLSQAVIPGMRERGWGRIINLASIAAQTGGAVGPHYAATKAALIGLTHGYATRLVKTGITVNALAPALIETEHVRETEPSMIPMARLGTPEEVAGAAIMLVRNGYITGQTININGGAYMSS